MIGETSFLVSKKQQQQQQKNKIKKPKKKKQKKAKAKTIKHFLWNYSQMKNTTDTNMMFP